MKKRKEIKIANISDENKIINGLRMPRRIRRSISKSVLHWKAYLVAEAKLLSKGKPVLKTHIGKGYE